MSSVARQAAAQSKKRGAKSSLASPSSSATDAGKVSSKSGAAACVEVRTRSASFGVKSSSRNEMFDVKVMRLASPSLELEHATAYGPDGALSSGSQIGAGYGNVLRLPSALNDVYVGERFRVLISLSHRFRYALKNVSIKVQLQTTDSKTLVMDTDKTDQDAFVFDVDEVKEFVLDYDVEHAGENCLVCTVQYQDEQINSVLRQSFHKFFKYTVLHPLRVCTGLHHHESVMFAECIITSTMNQPVFLDSVKFIPSPLFSHQNMNEIELLASHGDEQHSQSRSQSQSQSRPPLRQRGASTEQKHQSPLLESLANSTTAGLSSSDTDLKDNNSDNNRNSDDDDDDGDSTNDNQAPSSSPSSSLLDGKSPSNIVSTFGRVHSLQPQASRSYLYQIRLKNPSDTSAFSVGHFQISWRTSLGETGSFTTIQLHRDTTMKQTQKDFELVLVDTPSEVFLETPFTLQFQVRNRTNRACTIRLSLNKDKMGSILPWGSSSKLLGEFAAHETKVVSMEMLPLGLGVQKVSGFVLHCPELNHAHVPFNDVHQVLVKKTTTMM